MPGSSVATTMRYNDAMARVHPAAWYPDPRDPQRLRRWNGRRWTDETRPFPDWLRELRPAQGPAKRGAPLPRAVVARRLWSASSMALLAAVVILLSLVSSWRSSSVVADRVADRDFIAAAAAICAEAERNVFAPYRDAAVRQPDDLARSVEGVVDNLRAVDVAPADREAVDGWMAAWDDWTSAGFAYASALARADADAAEKISADSAVARSVINRFAYANGLTDCAL